MSMSPARPLRTVGLILVVLGLLVFMCGVCSVATPRISLGGPSSGWGGGSWDSGGWDFGGSDSGSWDSGGWDSGGWDSGGSDSGAW